MAWSVWHARIGVKYPSIMYPNLTQKLILTLDYVAFVTVNNRSHVTSRQQIICLVHTWKKPGVLYRVTRWNVIIARIASQGGF